MKNENQNQNQTIIFEPVTPHPQPVAIGELLADIENTIKRHVVLSDAAATALAVWVLHTYVYERRDTVAYVAIESPEKRCGKTTLLTVLAAMANKPLIASNVTVGALFRAIDTCRPTLFIDEADTFLAGNGVMRGIINSGNTSRTAYVLRLAKTKQNRARLSRHGAATADEQAGTPAAGSAHDQSPTTINNQHSTLNPPDTGLQRYSCWCPKVIAMIGKVPDTIADRSILVPMARKLTTEVRAPLAELDTAAIKAKAARFALDNGDTIARCGKIRGEGLNDRAADTFDPLYAIARLAGKEWEQKLQAAALAISPVGSKSSAAELLLDIYSVFLSSGKKTIFTSDLAERLRDEEFTVTSAVLRDSDLDEQKISQLLRSYGIKSIPCRLGSRVARGYAVVDFKDAIARYVPKADLEARTREIRNENKLIDEADNFAAKMGRTEMALE